MEAQKPGTATNKRYWLILVRSMWVALGVHVMFIALFYSIGATFLAVVNIGSVCIYALCVGLLRQQRNRLVIFLAWVEVIGHAALAVRSLGWDSGFHYYLLIFIPLIFVSPTRKPSSKVGLAMLLCFLYAGMDAVMRVVPPLSAVNPLALVILRYANITACFACLGYLAFFYSKIVGEAERRLRIMATTDSLTGLYNRRHIIGIAEYEKMRRKRSQHPLSFIIADIDDFKSVNDRYGHEIGDQTLTMVSRQVRGVLREQDSLARWGGEEFLMILPDTGLELAATVAERIRETIAATSSRQGEDELTITITLGVSECRENENIDACIARADQALYRGKKAGKDCVERA
ncbi:MAG: GGDEF domain-containing protein [Syntrophales bacterium]|nr:GGDEF domain-containing protein [Syntrophales bacterium]